MSERQEHETDERFDLAAALTAALKAQPERLAPSPRVLTAVMHAVRAGAGEEPAAAVRGERFSPLPVVVALLTAGLTLAWLVSQAIAGSLPWLAGLASGQLGSLAVDGALWFVRTLGRGLIVLLRAGFGELLPPLAAGLLLAAGLAAVRGGQLRGEAR